MTIEVILVPDLGGVDSVEVIELSISPGNRVELDESILVLESDKASMDVPSTAEGVLSRYLVKEGDSVNVGLPIAEIEIDSDKVTSISKEPVSINDVQSNTKNAQNEVNTDSNNNDVSDEMTKSTISRHADLRAIETNRLKWIRLRRHASR